MGLTELVLVSLVVGGCLISVILCLVILWRAIFAQRAAEEKYRQAREARLAAEQALRRAEEERRQVEQARNEMEQERQKAECERSEAEQILERVTGERLTAEADLAQAEEIRRTSAESVKEANLARNHAEEQARIAEENAQKAIQGRQEAEEHAGSLLHAVVDAERQLQEAIQSEREAIADRDRLAQESTAAQAQLKREEFARLSAETERDAALNEKRQISEELIRAQQQIERMSEHRQELKSKLELTEQELKKTKSTLAPPVPPLDTTGQKPKLKRPPRRGRNRSSEDRETEDVESPEILCIEMEHVWHLTLETSEQLAVRHAHQNNILLEKRDAQSWQLAAAYGKIEFDSEYAIPDIELGRANENCIVFKLIGKKKHRQGRRMLAVNSGAYLFVVPKTWEPTNPQLFSEPLHVSTAGYHAFYSVLEKNADFTLSFHTSLGPPRVVKSGKQKFELVGNRIEDGSDDMGTLFGGDLPKIHALNCDDWKEVSAIVVGEEGSGKPDWDAHVILSPLGQCQDIRVDITDLKGPWFFVRLYDRQDQLIESMDFRYIQGLHKIEINQPDPLPIGASHSPVRVEFHHAAGWLVKPVTDAEPQIPIERQDSLTVIQVPANANLDETTWNITSPNGETGQVRILVNRVWWSVGDENTEPSSWSDQVVTLHRQDIAATSSRAFWLRVPKPGWADRIELSLGLKTMLPVLLKCTEKAGALPLRNFRDHQAIDLIGKAPLQMRVLHQRKSHEGWPGTLLVEAMCRIAPCDFVTTRKQDLAQHFQACHLDKLFRPLTYAEYRETHPELPSRIAACLLDGCGYVAQSFRSENVTDLITRHIQQNRHYDAEGRMRFRELFRVEEIRKILPEIKLPYSFKCTRPGCGYIKELTSQAPAAMAELVQHWLLEHAKYLYEIR